MIDKAIEELHYHKNETSAKISQYFFKTGEGQYGENDKFIGIRTPLIKKIAIKYKDICLEDLKILLYSEIHEERFFAIYILVKKFNTKDNNQQEIFKFYLKHLNQINNWDLVDSSAKEIIGAYLYYFPQKNLLKKLAKSENLWHRRISIIATHFFIKKNTFNLTFEIAEYLLKDKEDLIHKAVGWMLREIGKRNLDLEKKFLDEYGCIMPRTMLRYAIEKFDSETRNYYMNLKFNQTKEIV